MIHRRLSTVLTYIRSLRCSVERAKYLTVPVLALILKLTKCNVSIAEPLLVSSLSIR
jgi:hypothetical protein